MRRPGTGGGSVKTLERALSKAGVGSRTQSRRWIAAGRVSVNGKTIRNPDHWVDLERDRMAFDGQPVRASRRVYILLYKPKGYLTTYRDPQRRATVYDLIPEVEEWVFPVGRLDLDTSGLLLLTNDTQLAEWITNPSSNSPWIKSRKHLEAKTFWPDNEAWRSASGNRSKPPCGWKPASCRLADGIPSTAG